MLTAGFLGSGAVAPRRRASPSTASGRASSMIAERSWARARSLAAARRRHGARARRRSRRLRRRLLGRARSRASGRSSAPTRSSAVPGRSAFGRWPCRSAGMHRRGARAGTRDASADVHGGALHGRRGAWASRAARSRSSARLGRVAQADAGGFRTVLRAPGMRRLLVVAALLHRRAPGRARLRRSGRARPPASRRSRPERRSSRSRSPPGSPGSSGAGSRTAGGGARRVRTLVEAGVVGRRGRAPLRLRPPCRARALALPAAVVLRLRRARLERARLRQRRASGRRRSCPGDRWPSPRR